MNVQPVSARVVPLRPIDARTRARLEADELHEHLVTAFDAVRPRGCDRCAVPRPVRVSWHDGQVGNWWLGPLPACPHGCGAFLRWLWQRYSALFDIRD